MARMRPLAAVIVLIVCIAGTPCTGTLMANEADSPSPDASSLQSPASNESHTPSVSPDDAATARTWAATFRFVPAEPDAVAPAAQSRRGRSRRRHGAAVAAIAAGAVASIAGAAVLVYANRPECRTHETASGCGYGTKVVGGAVISGGIVALVAGAVMAR
jgi:hypothetical protein